MKIGRHLVDTN